MCWMDAALTRAMPVIGSRPLLRCSPGMCVQRLRSHCRPLKQRASRWLRLPAKASWRDVRCSRPPGPETTIINLQAHLKGRPVDPAGTVSGLCELACHSPLLVSKAVCGFFCFKCVASAECTEDTGPSSLISPLTIVTLPWCNAFRKCDAHSECQLASELHWPLYLILKKDKPNKRFWPFSPCSSLGASVRLPCPHHGG